MLPGTKERLIGKKYEQSERRICMSGKRKNSGFGILKKGPVVLCAPEGAAVLVSENRTLVCLVRHGQTNWNAELRLQGREHVPLNDTGISQAKSCGELFKEAASFGFSVDSVFCSPLGRAETTARIISENIGIETVTPEPLLLERDYGSLSGLTMEERKRNFPGGEKQAGDVESVPDAASRMKHGLVKIAKESKGGPIIAVTHGGVLNALFLCITKGRVGTGKNISENCGISLLAVSDSATIPLAYGLTGQSFKDYISAYEKKTEEINAAGSPPYISDKKTENGNYQ